MYRKKTPPPPAPKKGWPFSDPTPPVRPIGRMDDVDLQIEELSGQEATRRQIAELLGKMFMVLCVAALAVGVLFVCVALMHADEEARDDCRRRGGRVELIHNSRDPNAWVCSGAHE